ncbi:hypothetical protein GCM10010232_43080 [Streptomyces amakusaensis]
MCHIGEKGDGESGRVQARGEHSTTRGIHVSPSEIHKGFDSVAAVGPFPALRLLKPGFRVCQWTPELAFERFQNDSPDLFPRLRPGKPVRNGGLLVLQLHPNLGTRSIYRVGELSARPSGLLKQSLKSRVALVQRGPGHINSPPVHDFHG